MREGIVTRYDNDLVACTFDEKISDRDKKSKRFPGRISLRLIERGHCEWLQYYIYDRIFGVEYFVNTDEEETVRFE